MRVEFNVASYDNPRIFVADVVDLPRVDDNVIHRVDDTTTLTLRVMGVIHFTHAVSSDITPAVTVIVKPVLLTELPL